MPSMQQVPQLHKKQRGSRALDQAKGLQGRIQEDGQSRESKDTGKSKRMYKMEELETHGRCMLTEVDAMREQRSRSMGQARGQQHSTQHGRRREQKPGANQSVRCIRTGDGLPQQKQRMVRSSARGSRRHGQHNNTQVCKHTATPKAAGNSVTKSAGTSPRAETIESIQAVHF